MRRVIRRLRLLGRSLSGLRRDQRGIESIEYLLIAALVIIAAAAAWRFLGQRVATNVNNVAGAVTEATNQSLEEGGFLKK
jgi:Flp pilus assembly pilin Flp